LSDWEVENDNLTYDTPGEDYSNQAFYYFLAQPMQWCGTTNNFCPLAKIGDGTVDLIVSTAATGGGKGALLKQFLDQEGANYWDERERRMRPERGMDYIKATEFEVDP